MKTVSMDELKTGLAGLVREAAAGETVLITRHNRQLAKLVGVSPAGLHVGRRFGKASLRPLLQAPSGGRYLEELAADRAESDGDR